MIDIEELKFDEKGLIPAIVADAVSKKVLTLAYMNRESLAISVEKGLTCFWSRSRQELWLKGETSGNYQHIVSVTADCDRDALLVLVEKDGPACHLGTDSCFSYPLWQSAERSEFSLRGLFDLLEERKATRPEGSYTSYLFDKGLDKILKKVGEECTEVIIAAKAEDRRETVYEIADLCYHVLVLMAQQGITPEEVQAELASRQGQTGKNDMMRPSAAYCRRGEGACSLLRALACVRRSHTGRLRRVFPEAHVPGKNVFLFLFRAAARKTLRGSARHPMRRMHGLPCAIDD